jgi:hypothetical protein
MSAIGKTLITRMNLDYTELHREESAGSYGAFGIKILVALHPPHEQGEKPIEVDLNQEKIRFACYDAKKLIQGAVMDYMISQLPAAQARRKAEREEILGCFGDAPIHVEEVPNGYCSDYCCKHLPWFVVTTKVGRIKIGWRKRVINIDWSETQGTKTAEELFKSESSTKGDRYIHAWGCDKAREYVKAIVSGVPLQAA